MLKDGYKILDLDEGYPESEYLKIHAKAIKICRERGAVLDLATSDVNIFVENADHAVASLVLDCYPGASMQKEDTERWVIF